MNHSVELELLSVIKDYLVDNDIQEIDEPSELHDAVFNQDYYIIGYYNAEQWLKKHDISAWEAIETVAEYQEDHFGEGLKTDDINAERIVNLLAYWYGYDLINDLTSDYDTVEAIIEYIDGELE